MAITDTAIETAATNPKRATVDGTSVEGQALQDLLAVQRAQLLKAAQAKNHLGISFRSLEPGGCG